MRRGKPARCRSDHELLDAGSGAHLRDGARRAFSWDLVDSGRLDEARVLAPFFGRVQPKLGSIMLWIVRLSRKQEGQPWVGHMLQAAVLASPDDGEVQAAWVAWRETH